MEDVSTLKQLMNDDSPPQQQTNQSQSALDEMAPLPKSKLGSSLDELMFTWSQLLTNITSKPPIPPPSTVEHVKEVAEICIKQWRDAALDVNTELTKLCLQWELDHPEEKYEDELKDLKEAISRQDGLLGRARLILESRTDEFFGNPK